MIKPHIAWKFLHCLSANNSYERKLYFKFCYDLEVTILAPSKASPLASSVRGTWLTVCRLADRERNITILYHVLNLLAHCDRIKMSSDLSSSHNEMRSTGGILLVKTKRMNQYMSKMGQNTGTLKISNQLQTNEMAIARVAECQNLNSGRRRMKGRNSSSCLVGRPPAAPSSISLSMISFEGSNLGWRKARKRLSR